MEETIREELIQFLKQKVPAETLSSVDDIVLGYIVNVLEQLGEDDEFDVDDFSEIMTAYIPEFDEVNRDAVQSWMLDLADKLVKSRTARNTCSFSDAYTVMREDKCSRSVTSLEPKSVQSGDIAKDHQIITSLRQFSSCEQGTNSFALETGKLSPVSKNNCNQDTKAEHYIELKESVGNASFREEILMLTEVFPEACSLEIQNCLMVANGDVESAVQLMLVKKENIDEEWKENVHQTVDHVSPKTHLPTAKKEQLHQDEQQGLKEQIMAKYGYVEVSQDEKSYQPILHKQDEKKLVRYRDNQVVSTKGERFSLVKQEESEEMKKTYVNIKPARKYRFH